MASNVITQYTDIVIRAKSEATKVFGDLEKSAKNAIDATKDFGSEFKNLAIVGGVVATAVAAAGATLVALAKHAADVGDELNDLSKKTGSTVEELSTLRLAAAQSGTSMEGLTTGLKFMARSMVEAVQKGGETAEAFKKLGVHVEYADGTMRPTLEVFKDFSEAISKMPDGAEKTALSMQVLGRSGEDLIPMMNEGRAGIAAMQQESRRLGDEWSGPAAKAGDELNDRLAIMKAQFSAGAEAAGRQLVPALSALVGMVIRMNEAFAKDVRTTGSFFSWLTGGEIEAASNEIAKLGPKFQKATKEITASKEEMRKSDEKGAKDRKTSQEADLAFQSKLRVFLGEYAAGKSEIQKKIEEEDDKARKKKEQAEEKARREYEKAEKEHIDGLKKATKERYDDESKVIARALEDKKTQIQRAREADIDAIKAQTQAQKDSVQQYIDSEDARIDALQDSIRARREAEDTALRERRDALKADMDLRREFIQRHDQQAISEAEARFDRENDLAREAHEKQLDDFTRSLDARNDAAEKALDDEMELRDRALDDREKQIEKQAEGEIETRFRAEVDAANRSDVSLIRKRQLVVEAEERKKEAQKGVRGRVKDEIDELKRQDRVFYDRRKDELKRAREQAKDLVDAKKRELADKEKAEKESQKRSLEQARLNLQNALEAMRRGEEEQLSLLEDSGRRRTRLEEDLAVTSARRRLDGYRRQSQDLEEAGREAEERLRASFTVIDDALTAEERLLQDRRDDWDNYWDAVEVGAKDAFAALQQTIPGMNSAQASADGLNYQLGMVIHRMGFVPEQVEVIQGATSRLNSALSASITQLSRLTGISDYAAPAISRKAEEVQQFASAAARSQTAEILGDMQYEDRDRSGNIYHDMIHTGPDFPRTTDFYGNPISYSGQGGYRPLGAGGDAGGPNQEGEGTGGFIIRPPPNYDPFGGGGVYPVGGRTLKVAIELNGRELGEQLFQMSRDGTLSIAKGAVKER